MQLHADAVGTASKFLVTIAARPLIINGDITAAAAHAVRLIDRKWKSAP